MACEVKAENIVRDLFKVYIKHKDLVPKDYRENTIKAYKLDRSNKNLCKFITARNYIAGMTDAFAITQHARLFMSSEHVRFS